MPDIVVGTSIGALVGGCYVSGQLEALEALARSLTLRRIIGYLDVRIGGSGLISGGRLTKRLEQALGARTSRTSRYALPRSPPRSAPATKFG